MTPDDAGTASYKTIQRPVETETEIKRSRFICFLEPVDNEEDARSRIAQIRALHPKARHHCSAFVLGERQQTQRTNDDGEPSGTAGAPMLDALLGAELSDVLAVVVRYFGGVLLGAGGLTRAYRASVAEAVASSTVVVRELRMSVEISTDYASAALIEAEAYRRGWVVLGSDYAEAVVMTLSVPPGQLDLVRQRVAELTAGRSTPREVGVGYVTLAP